MEIITMIQQGFFFISMAEQIISDYNSKLCTMQVENIREIMSSERLLSPN